MNSLPAGLHLFGLGVRPSDDATLETLQALERCDAVFHDLSDPRQKAWLERALPKARPAPGAAALAKLARASSVGLAVWGHPQHASAAAGEARQAAKAMGVPAIFWPANSPLARAVAHSATFVGGTEGHGGVIGHPAASLAQEPSRARPQLPLAVYDQKGGAALWRAVGAALAPLYPASQEAFVLPCEGAPRRLALSALGELSCGAVVLVVPPKGRRR